MSTKMNIKLLLIGSVLFVILLSTACGGTTSPLPEPSAKAPGKAVKTPVMRAPDIHFYVSATGLAQTGVNVDAEAVIDNPNPFSLDISNLQVVATNENGDIYAQSTDPGGTIAPNLSATFKQKLVIPFAKLNEKRFVIKLDARATAEGDTKPVSASEMVYIPDVRNYIKLGNTLDVKTAGLSSAGLKANLHLKVSNPSALPINVGMLQIQVKSQGGKFLTHTNITGTTIAPNSDATFTGDVTIPIEVLNDPTFTLTADAMASAVNITIPVNATAKVQVPKLNTLISVPEMKVDIEQTWMGSFPWLMLQVVVKSTMINNNDISLVVSDFNTRLYKPDGSLLRSLPMLEATINPLSTVTYGNPVVLGREFATQQTTGTQPTPGAQPTRSEILDLIDATVTVKVDTQVGVQGSSQRIFVNGAGSFVIKLTENWPAPR